MRQDKLENYIETAEVQAKMSHDEETKVGAVLINTTSGAILATGFNGFVRGAPDEILPKIRPDKYEYMLHAEENILTNCVRHGISTMDCMVVCTLSPCKRCTRLLVNAGISQVVVKALYRDFNEVQKMFDVNVRMEQVNGLYHIYYNR